MTPRTPLEIAIDRATGYDPYTARKEKAHMKTINGFQIDEDFKMPDPPEPGLVPYVAFHGGDGLSLFWDYPVIHRSDNNPEFPKGRYPSPMGPKNMDWYIDEEPVIDPDTGGMRYKECEQVFAELGFTIL